jgi:hypothetical protein
MLAETSRSFFADFRFQHLDKDKKGYLIRKDMLSIPEVRCSKFSA